MVSGTVPSTAALVQDIVGGGGVRDNDGDGGSGVASLEAADVVSYLSEGEVGVAGDAV